MPSTTAPTTKTGIRTTRIDPLISRTTLPKLVSIASRGYLFLTEIHRQMNSCRKPIINPGMTPPRNNLPTDS